MSHPERERLFRTAILCMKFCLLLDEVDAKNNRGKFTYVFLPAIHLSLLKISRKFIEQAFGVRAACSSARKTPSTPAR